MRLKTRCWKTRTWPAGHEYEQTQLRNTANSSKSYSYRAKTLHSTKRCSMSSCKRAGLTESGRRQPLEHFKMNEDNLRVRKGNGRLVTFLCHVLPDLAYQRPNHHTSISSGTVAPFPSIFNNQPQLRYILHRSTRKTSARTAPTIDGL
jgi:hypothetical protein